MRQPLAVVPGSSGTRPQRNHAQLMSSTLPVPIVWGVHWLLLPLLLVLVLCCHQALFDGRVLPMDRLQKFFPASSVPDITRHRCWVSYR